jgi:outer membrane lipoprotein-sorting protein
MEVSEIRVVVRRDTSMPVRTEFWESSGDHTWFDFTDFRRNTGLAERVFRFDPPEGTEIFELEGETW